MGKRACNTGGKRMNAELYALETMHKQHVGKEIVYIVPDTECQLNVKELKVSK